MKTKTLSPVRKLVLGGMFLALGLLLPIVTAGIPRIGNALCPMHFPVLLCGFVLGAPYGLAVGFVTPLLRSVLFGMPPMFPIAIAMAFELATYGLVAGALSGLRRGRGIVGVYAVLLAAMVSGRLVWGAARFVLAGMTGGQFPLQMFLAGAIFNAVPGIIAQLILIPAILAALQKAKYLD